MNIGSFDSPEDSPSRPNPADEASRQSEEPVSWAKKGEKAVSNYGNAGHSTNLYILLRAPEGGRALPGLFRGTWAQFKEYCGGVLPKTGFHYRRPDDLAEAQLLWNKQGHRGKPTWIQK